MTDSIKADPAPVLRTHPVPAPWSYDDESGQVIAAKSVQQIVAEVPSMEHYSQADTGRLLASAPALLEALQMLYSETADYSRLNNLGGMDNQCMRLARAAISKATGA